MSQLKFKMRGFISLVTTFSFIISLVSGIVLYFTPQGKIANWTYWTFWGLDKHTWGAMHINSSLVFFIVSIFHIYYNWKLLVGYIKKRAQMAFNFKPELALTIILSVFLVLASIYDYEPFGTIMKWNDDIKGYWANKAYAEPPVPHAEELSIKDFCEKFGIEIATFRQKVEQQSWTVQDNSQLMSNLAKSNNVAPADIYALVTGKSNLPDSGGNGGGSGRGWGRKTVEEVCAESNIKLEDAIAKLSQNNLKATKTSTIRDLSAQLKVRPTEVVEMITGQKVEHAY